MGITDSSTSTTVDNPIADIQAEHLKGIYTQANNLYNEGSPDYYPGSTVVATDPVRAQGQNIGVDTALGAQTDLANNQTSLINNILSGNDPYTQQLAQQGAAGVASTFGQAGSLGSARNYQQGNLAASNAILSRQLDASQQVGDAQRNAYRPAQTLQNIGAEQQLQSQLIRDADIQRYEYEANRDSNHLKNYQDIVTNPSAAAYEQGSNTSNNPSTLSSLSSIIGIGATLAGLGGNQGGPVGGMLASGGYVHRRNRGYGMLAEGGDVTQTQLPPVQPQVPTQEVGRGIYTPVDVERTTYPDSNWTRPSPGYGWAIIDGRYQLVPSEQGILPGGGTVGRQAVDPIAQPTYGTGTTTTPTTGGTNDNTVDALSTKTDANGNPAPYLGVDPYDKEGDDNFLTTAEIDARVKAISDVIGADYDPNTTILTEEQQALVENDLNARLAMSDIYHNNQVIYGSQTGNNLTSATTGSLTNTGFKADALATITAISPVLGALLPKDFSEKTFGDNTQAQFDAQTAYYAKQAGAKENANGTYDISAWFNPEFGKSSNRQEGVAGDLYDDEGNLLDRFTGKIKGFGDAIIKVADKFLGTQYLEDQHPTNVIHTQVNTNTSKPGEPNANGLGVNNNYDSNGNPRPDIPQELIDNPGTGYYNKTTGAWTNKETGIPYGGSIVETKSPVVITPDPTPTPPVVVQQDNRDKQSDGSKALADSTRAQLDFTSKNKATTPGAASDYGDVQAQGGYIQKHNQGGSVQKLSAWTDFRKRYGV